MFVSIKYRAKDNMIYEGKLNPLHITSIVKVDYSSEFYIDITTNGADDVNRISLSFKNKDDRDQKYNDIIFDWENALFRFVVK